MFLVAVVVAVETNMSGYMMRTVFLCPTAHQDVALASISSTRTPHQITVKFSTLLLAV